MRAAMAAAEVGDDLAGEDPTVNRLQTLSAALLGYEAALYVPTGTMANQLAIRAQSLAGTDVICGPRAPRALRASESNHRCRYWHLAGWRCFAPTSCL